MAFKHFFPNEIADSVYHIDYDIFWQKGIRGLIFDIDNTLATFDTPHPDAAVIELLTTLTKKGFKIAFLSNNKKERVKIFNKEFGFPHIWKAGKPRLSGMRRALESLGLSKRRVILIGDQIFTDCWVGRRAGVYTILTKPIALKDEWQVKLKRYPEKLVLWAYRRKRRD
ncbi:MAG: YqeG family HAD IIIA-type phosphatase [Defluviitaleaceae bacterium]|nr:YqeG family HAD IIIA-type phosphatase [Defluviitaleaceae bacterium]